MIPDCCDICGSACHGVECIDCMDLREGMLAARRMGDDQRRLAAEWRAKRSDAGDQLEVYEFAAIARSCDEMAKAYDLRADRLRRDLGLRSETHLEAAQ